MATVYNDDACIRSLGGLYSAGTGVTGGTSFKALITNPTTNAISVGIEMNSGSATIDWGDGSSNTITAGGTYDPVGAWLTNNGDFVSHTYSTTTPTTLTITGDVKHLIVNDNQISGETMQVQSFGSAPHNIFYLPTLTAVPTVLPSYITDLSYMFAACHTFNQDISGWDTTNVTNMKGMFKDAFVYNQPLNSWNTANVTDMSYMFYQSSTKNGFNQPLNNWNTSNVTNMEYMFHYQATFNQPLSNWDTSKVTSMRGMFYYAIAFNQDISSWNVGAVTTLADFLIGCTAFNQPMNVWNVSSVTDMYGVFQNCAAFNQPLNAWNVANVTRMDYMFNSAAVFDQNLTHWCVQHIPSQPTSFSDTGCPLTTPHMPIWGTCPAIDPVFRMTIHNPSWAGFDYKVLSGSAVVDWGDGATTIISGQTTGFGSGDYQGSGAGDGTAIFAEHTYAAGVISADITVTGIMDVMAWYLDWQPVDIVNFGNTRRCTFAKLNALTMCQLSPTMTDLSYMFLYAYENGSTYIFPDITGWDTSNITNMEGMFNYATILSQDISGWDVSNVVNMKETFIGSGFNAPIGSWNVGNVTDFSGTFQYATSFNQPLNGWNVSSATNMYRMFSNAEAFNQPLNLWDVHNVVNMDYMFGAASLFDQDLTHWCVSLITTEPDNFSVSCPLTAPHKPVWGTCPV